MTIWELCLLTNDINCYTLFVLISVDVRREEERSKKNSMTSKTLLALRLQKGKIVQVNQKFHQQTKSPSVLLASHLNDGKTLGIIKFHCDSSFFFLRFLFINEKLERQKKVSKKMSLDGGMSGWYTDYTWNKSE